MITKYLPEFKVFEVGSLTGLRAGHVVSQLPAAVDSEAKTVKVATVEFSGRHFIENGVIMGLDADGKLVNWTSGTMFVHYTEELNTFVDELKYFAVPVEEQYNTTNKKYEAINGATYPRGIALYAGDSFCTNNVTIASDASAESKYATVNNGVLQLQKDSTGAHFAVSKTTLPNGDDAYDFVYIG